MMRTLRAWLASRAGRLVLGGLVALAVGRVLWVDGSRLMAGLIGGTVGLATVGLALACLLPCLLPLALLRRKQPPAAALAAATPDSDQASDGPASIC